MWNQLRDEHEELVIKGYTGEGFLSQGKRLGGSRIPIEEARRRARAAAEQRRILAKNSGKRLGGAPVLRGTDMRKLRADAAQRRLEVTQGCASGTDHSTELAEEASRNGFRTKAEEDDANEQAIMQAFIELIQQEEREKYGSSYIPPSQENPAGPQTAALLDPSSSSQTGPARSSETILGKTAGVRDLTDNSSYEAPWSCPTCTLENPPNFLCCNACAAERPAPSNQKPLEPQREPAIRHTAPPERPRHNKRPLQEDEKEANDESIPRDTFTFKNRTRALDTLAYLDRDANKKPLGWICTSCGSFMETQWWTCSCCGKMKPSS